MSDDPAVRAGVDAARDAIKGGYQGRTLEHLVEIGIKAARPIHFAQARAEVLAELAPYVDSRVGHAYRTGERGSASPDPGE